MQNNNVAIFQRLISTSSQYVRIILYNMRVLHCLLLPWAERTLERRDVLYGWIYLEVFHRTFVPLKHFNSRL